MKKSFFNLKVIAILLVICFFISTIVFLKWDDNKSLYEIIDINKNILQEKSDSLPIPIKKIEGEDSVKLKNFKGIISYYVEPIPEHEAAELIVYYQAEEENYNGTFTSLDGNFAGAFVGRQYYSSIVKKLGYGWFSYDGNLYAKYYTRDKAKGKPNYQNQFKFSFTKSNATYRMTVFCNQKNPEKALSATIDYISTLINNS